MNSHERLTYLPSVPILMEKKKSMEISKWLSFASKSDYDPKQYPH